MLKRKKSVRPCHLRTMKEEREQGISHVRRQGRSEWCLRRTWKCFWCCQFNACYPFHLLNDSKEKKILNAADHRSEAMRGIPKCCWKRKLITRAKFIPLGKQQLPRGELFDCPLLCVECMTWILSIGRPFAISALVFLCLLLLKWVRKTWKHVKMGNLAACLCSGIAHLLVWTTNQHLPTVVTFSL